MSNPTTETVAVALDVHKSSVRLAAVRAAEEKVLQTYGWVDKEQKIVRIPIDRAMELLAERGLPARKDQKK